MPNMKPMWQVQFEWDDAGITRPFPIGIATTHEAADELAARYRESRDLHVDRVWEQLNWAEWRLHVASENGKIRGYIYKLLVDSFTEADAHEAFTPTRTQIR